MKIIKIYCNHRMHWIQTVISAVNIFCSRASSCMLLSVKLFFLIAFLLIFVMKHIAGFSLQKLNQVKSCWLI